MSNVGEVVTVISMMGEIVGRLKEETTTGYELESPRLFVPAQGDASGGFAPGLSMTGEQHPASAHVNKGLVMTVVKTHEQVAKGWQEATSSIVLP